VLGKACVWATSLGIESDSAWAGASGVGSVLGKACVWATLLEIESDSAWEGASVLGSVLGKACVWALEWDREWAVLMAEMQESKWEAMLLALELVCSTAVRLAV
jgi:hypothetical protein